MADLNSDLLELGIEEYPAKKEEKPKKKAKKEE